MGELTIREMGQDEDFSNWFSELLEREAAELGETSGGEAVLSERYLVLSNEIGDWVGGLRFYLRGGVAHLVDVAVTAEHRHQGYAHRLLAAFEERARQTDAHLAEFWTDDHRSEGLLAALGWDKVMVREGYIGRRPWALMEKRLDQKS
jgi:GNAT superfamily N-acetyltransferase